MAFLTGSVVVPATLETRARSWLVRAFTRLDLPVLVRPKKAMCILSELGVAESDINSIFLMIFTGIY